MTQSLRKAAPPAPAGGADDARADLRAILIDRLRRIRRAYRLLIGIPDYESYLAHMAERHPSEPVLSRQEFCARAIDRKYGKGGPRCC